MNPLIINEQEGRKLQNFYDILFNGRKIEIDPKSLQRVERAYDFLKSFSKGKVIYGVNTGFGPMAQYSIPQEDLHSLQYNLIRSHCTGTGEEISQICVKSAMICRLLNILNGASGIHPQVPLLLKEFINRDIIPVVYQHGSVGSSGDLVQLAHIALALIGEGEVHYKGNICPTAEALEKEGLTAIKVHIREGLSLINGTSVMTGIGIVNLIYANRLLKWGIVASAFVNEIMEAFDEGFSDGLNRVKDHPGQQIVASLMREFLSGSKLISKRKDYLYNGIPDQAVFRKKVQEYYSLRCVPQILGPVYDTFASAEEVLMAEAVSVNDNPIIDLEDETVLHGGNFHGDYVSLEMDKLKIATTRLAMVMERQLNFVLNPNLNDKFPPFVNLGRLGVQLGMQAAQFTATSTTAECQSLSFPNYVHSIPNNNDNQDIVSMGTNSALLCRKVILNAYEVTAIHFMCLCQAVDSVEMASQLSPHTKAVYHQIREIFPPYKDDGTLYRPIASVRNFLFNNDEKEF